jgi:hypothetical protein
MPIAQLALYKRDENITAYGIFLSHNNYLSHSLPRSMLTLISPFKFSLNPFLALLHPFFRTSPVPTPPESSAPNPDPPNPK